MKKFSKKDKQEVEFVEKIVLSLLGKYSKEDAEKIIYSQIDNMNCLSELYTEIVDYLLEKHFKD